MTLSSRSLFLSLLSFSSFSAAVDSNVEAPEPKVSASVASTCAEIKLAIPGMLHMPKESAYTKENKDYWNYGLSELMPACIAMPTMPEHVAKIVKILTKKDDVPFAIKSGGHDPNPGHSSVKAGVLIALKNMAGVEYNRERNVVYVKPGGHWADVIRPLDALGVTVVSGRLGTVGIGGFLMQGGISFLSAQHGLAADNILEYEVVLANGTIANINTQNNPELVTAMRGGGDQFGIVTKFTLQAHPMGKVWGGTRMYNGASKAAVFAGLHDFIDNNHKDPKAAIIFTSGVAGIEGYTIFYCYDGPNPPKGAFGKLEDIKPLYDMTSVQSYTSLITMTDALFPYMVQRTSFRSITLPHLSDDPAYYERVEAKWAEITAPFNKVHWTAGATLAYQAFPNTIGNASEARGGNAMGLSGKDHARFIIEIAGVWNSKKDDEEMWSMARTLTNYLTEDLVGIEKKAATAGRSISYNPLFMNDAGPDQDVFSSYKDVDKFYSLQRSVDPNGFFAKRAGGYKFKVKAKAGSK